MENKKIDLFSIDITYDCNMDCLHCFNHSGECHENSKEYLNSEEIINIIEQACEFRPGTICICGGETLLREDLIYKISKKTKELVGNKTVVSLVTNGQLMTSKIANKIKKSGINNVQVSLDGATPETYNWFRNQEGSYEKAIAAIKYFKEANINVMVSTCPNKKNLNEYDDIIKLCESLGVSSHRVQPLMMLGRSVQNLKEYVPNRMEYFKLERLLSSYQGELNVEWGDPLEHLSRVANNNNMKTYSLSVDAYGEIMASPYIPIRFGDVRKDSLKDIWDKGFNNVWNYKFIKEICEMFESHEEMDLNLKDPRFPKHYIEQPIQVDLSKVTSNLTLKELLGSVQYD